MTKKVIETVNGWYMENPKQKVELDEIVGLVNTDEPTDSVQLKKEAQLSICEKRIIELEKENEQLKSDRVRFEEETRLEITRVMDKIFELIDKKIEFYKHNPVSAPINNPANPNYDDVDRLARLSELEDLKETLKELEE